MKSGLVMVLFFLSFSSLHAQTILSDPRVYAEGGLSYNLVDGYTYNRIGDLADLPGWLFPLRVNLGLRADVNFYNQTRLGARLRGAFLNYGYKSTNYYIVELPVELTWTFNQELPVYLFGGYCIGVLDGLGGVDFGIHGELNNFFVEIAPKVYDKGAFGLNAMLGYSYHFEN